MLSTRFVVYSYLTLLVSAASAFTSPSTAALTRSTSATQLAFGLPDFMTPKEVSSDDNDEVADVDKDKMEEKKIGLAGIVQLITAGAGAPFL